MREPSVTFAPFCKVPNVGLRVFEEAVEEGAFGVANCKTKDGAEMTVLWTVSAS